jgi:adenosylcobinamide-GDP ribazoletransferase
MTFMANLVREFLLAIQFFTRIPVTGRLAAWAGFSPELLRASAAHFPLAGAIVGCAAALVYALTLALLPGEQFSALAAAIFSTVATALLTGAFHEDGLADVADGLGGSFDRDRALEIMKDSRVGAFGALALMLALLAKVALLAILGSVEGLASDLEVDQRGFNWFFNGWYATFALALGHVVSRGLPLLLIRLLPYVGDSATSKAKPLADRISTGRLLIGLAWCLAALALSTAIFDVFSLLVSCGFALAALLYMGRLFKRRLQGFTGDCLGATQQVCEIAFYFGLAVTV